MKVQIKNGNLKRKIETQMINFFLAILNIIFENENDKSQVTNSRK